MYSHRDYDEPYIKTTNKVSPSPLNSRYTIYDQSNSKITKYGITPITVHNTGIEYNPSKNKKLKEQISPGNNNKEVPSLMYDGSGGGSTVSIEKKKPTFLQNTIGVNKNGEISNNDKLIGNTYSYLIESRRYMKMLDQQNDYG